MKYLFKRLIALALLLLSTSVYAGDTFKSTDAKCQITFPGKYDVETVKEVDLTTITVSCNQGGMIYMIIVSIRDENIAQDEEEADLVEILSLYNFALKLEAKLKSKKVFTFNVYNESGFYGYIKGKLDVGQKKKAKYEGNYYVITRKNIMYQFTALGAKNFYEERSAINFSDSFNFME
jgi:hypothetical protein